MLALIAAASEPSKVPFYIAGGALAVYAVALAAVGLTRPSFPFSLGGQRAVMALSFVMMVVAIGAAVLTDP
jgi:hypothetical protein